MKHETEPRVFFYVEGNPLKGMWVDLQEADDWDTIREHLKDELNLEHLPDEILAADAEGVAKVFLGDHGTFDLDKYREWDAKLGDHVPADAVIAFFDHFGDYEDPEMFEDMYRGQHDSEEEYAKQFMDDMHGKTIQLAESSGLHIDWEATARELFISDVVSVKATNGGDIHVFTRH